VRRFERRGLCAIRRRLVAMLYLAAKTRPGVRRWRTPLGYSVMRSPCLPGGQSTPTAASHELPPRGRRRSDDGRGISFEPGLTRSAAFADFRARRGQVHAVASTILLMNIRSMYDPTASATGRPSTGVTAVSFHRPQHPPAPCTDASTTSPGRCFFVSDHITELTGLPGDDSPENTCGRFDSLVWSKPRARR